LRYNKRSGNSSLHSLLLKKEKRKMKKLLIGLLLIVGMGEAQTPPPFYTQLSQQPLPPVNRITANFSGAQGNNSLYYWVVAKYFLGNAALSIPYMVGGIGNTGSVAISWSAPYTPNNSTDPNQATYSLSYDVLRTTSPSFPANGSCSNCLVASNISSLNTTDTITTSLAGYTTNTFNPQPSPATLLIDNTNFQKLLFEVLVNGKNILPDSAAIPCPVATVLAIGCVKPDGTSITITADGTISATGISPLSLPTINAGMSTAQAQAVINTGGNIYALAGNYTSGPFTFPNGGGLICSGPYSTNFTYSGTGPFFSPTVTAANQQMNIQNCGLTLTNSSAIGITTKGVWSSTISGNFITGGNVQILMDGTSLGSYENTVSDNVLTNATYGIEMTGGSGQFANNNTVSNNYITGMVNAGIWGVNGGCQGNYLFRNNVSGFAGTNTIGIDYECVNGVLNGVNWVESIATAGQTFTGVKLRNGGNNLSGTKYSLVASGGTVTQLDYLKTDPNIIGEISTGSTPIYSIRDTTGFLPFLISSTGSSAYQLADTSLGLNTKYWETSVSAAGVCLTALQDDGITALISPACWKQSGVMTQLGSINMGGVGQDARYFANSADNTIQGDFGCVNGVGCILETTTANNFLFRYNTSPVMTLVAGGLNVTGTVNTSINFAVGATTVADSTSAIGLGGTSSSCAGGSFATSVTVSVRGVPSTTCGAGSGGTVTSVSASAPITSSGGATPNISATYQGNGAKVQASTGSTTTNDCVKFDANGNTIDAGAACGTTLTIASGTASLGTGAISSGTCATTVTVAGTGIATTDDIIADFNASPLAVTGYTPSANGMLAIIKWPTSGNVNFAVCNNTGSSITPGAITLNWRVVR
jgi:parallel beta-helix repeat protein